LVKGLVCRNAAGEGEDTNTTSPSHAPHPLEVPPPMIVSTEPGTWAHDTMSRRIRETILSKVFTDNDLNSDQEAALKALDLEMQQAGTTLLRDINSDGGPDIATWQEIMAPYVGKATWLEAPWLTAEFYFYRRVVEAMKYFELREDPFRKQKDLGLKSADAAVENLCRQLAGMTSGLLADGTMLRLKSEAAEQSRAIEDEVIREIIELFVLTALWGNRMDLSLWPEDGTASNRAGDAFSSALAAGEKYLIHDDLKRVSQVLFEARLEGGRRVDIVVDNAGFELVCDLCLADVAIITGAASVVKLHLKGHPTFVSDAMGTDVMATVESVSNMFGAVGTVGKRWKEHIETGRWELSEHMYWAQPTPFWDMPADVSDDLKKSCIVFLKGDANYRRLLGDSPWPLTKPFDEVAGYFPTRLCALRTLKAELGCGMEAGEIERARADDADWLTSGQWGVCQFTEMNCESVEDGDNCDVPQ